MDEDVREAIQLTVMCQRLNCLPSAGGLLDQDSRLVWVMEQVIMAQDEKAELDKKKSQRRT